MVRANDLELLEDRRGHTRLLAGDPAACHVACAIFIWPLIQLYIIYKRREISRRFHFSPTLDRYIS